MGMTVLVALWGNEGDRRHCTIKGYPPNGGGMGQYPQGSIRRSMGLEQAKSNLEVGTDMESKFEK